MSQLESEAMLILWKADQPISANEVVARMWEEERAKGSKELPNYTTIASMLMRLVAHELLSSKKLSPRNIVYAPALTRADYLAALASGIIDQLALTPAERIIIAGHFTSPELEGEAANA